MSPRSTLHVLHVVDALSLGGAERMLVEIANRTVTDGHRVSVCVTRSGVAMAPRLDPRIELLVLNRRRRVEFGPLRRLAKWCATNAVDIVHCHGRSSFSLIALLEATWLVRKPTLLHDHSSESRMPSWLRFAQRYLSAYVGVYEQQVAWARQAGIAAERVHIIPNAIEMAALEQQPVLGPPLQRRDGWAQLICIGGLRREKAIDVLLDAFSKVQARACLHIIGGDANESYARLCRDRARMPDLVDRVVFEGQRDQAHALARTADLAVHASRSESGPLVLLEYAAVKVPFVSTRVGGVAVALANANAGRFVPAEDAGALAQAIEETLAVPSDQRRRMGERAYESARSLFDLSVAMPQWYRLYDRMMADV